jgi:hypothetical protein
MQPTVEEVERVMVVLSGVAPKDITLPMVRDAIGGIAPQRRPPIPKPEWILAMERDEVRHERRMAAEVVQIRAWLRENLGMAAPFSDGAEATLGIFSGTCTHLWNCIVRARCALGLRRLQPEPIMTWVGAVFNVTVTYNIDAVARALGYEDEEMVRGESESVITKIARDLGWPDPPKLQEPGDAVM